MSLTFTPYPLVAGEAVRIEGTLGLPIEIVELFLDCRPVESEVPELIHTLARPGAVVLNPVDPSRFSLVTDEEGGFDLRVEVPQGLSPGDHLVEVRVAATGLTFGAVVLVVSPEEAAAAVEGRPFTGGVRLDEDALQKMRIMKQKGSSPSRFMPTTDLEPLQYMAPDVDVESLSEEGCTTCGSEEPVRSSPRLYTWRDTFAPTPPLSMPPGYDPGPGHRPSEPPPMEPVQEVPRPPRDWETFYCPIEPPYRPRPVFLLHDQREVNSMQAAPSPGPMHHTDNRKSDAPDLLGNDTHIDGPRRENYESIVQPWTAKLKWPVSGVAVGSDASLYQMSVSEYGKVDPRTGDIANEETDLLMTLRLALDTAYSEELIPDTSIQDQPDEAFWVWVNPLVMQEGRLQANGSVELRDKLFFVSGGQLWKMAHGSDVEGPVVEGFVDLRWLTCAGEPPQCGGFVVSRENPRIILFGVQTNVTEGDYPTWAGTKPYGYTAVCWPTVREGKCGGTLIVAVDSITLRILDVFDIARYFTDPTIDYVTDHWDAIVTAGNPFFEPGGLPPRSEDPVFTEEPQGLFSSYLNVNMTNCIALGRDPREGMAGYELIYGIIYTNYVFAVGFNPNPATGERYFYNSPRVEWRQLYAPSRSGSTPTLERTETRLFICTGYGPVIEGHEEFGRKWGGWSTVWALDCATGQVLSYTPQLGEVPTSPVVTQKKPEVEGWWPPTRMFVSVMGRSLYGFSYNYNSDSLHCEWKSGAGYRTMGVNTIVAGEMYYSPFFNCYAAPEEDTRVWSGGFPIDQYAGCEPQDEGVLCQSRCGPAPDWMFPNQRLDISVKVMGYLSDEGLGLETGFVPFMPPGELVVYWGDIPK